MATCRSRVGSASYHGRHARRPLRAPGAAHRSPRKDFFLGQITRWIHRGEISGRADRAYAQAAVAHVVPDAMLTATLDRARTRAVRLQKRVVVAPDLAECVLAHVADGHVPAELVGMYTALWIDARNSDA